MTARAKQLILLLGDWALLYLALFLALWLRYQHLPSAETWHKHWPIFSFIFFIWLIVFYLQNLYDLRQTKNNLAFFRLFLTSLGINLLLTVGFFYVVGRPQITPKTILILLTLFYLPLLALWRLVMHFLLGAGALKQRLLFLGLTPEALELIKLFHRDPQIGYETALVVAEAHHPLTLDLPAGLELRTTLMELVNAVKEKKIDTVVLAIATTDPNLNRLLYETILSRVNITNIDSLYEILTNRVPLSALKESWFLENLKETQKHAYDLAKRLIDIVLALIMSIFFLIFLLPIAIIIYLYDRGPVLYHQTRVGRDGQIFTIFKFRTMIPEAEKNGRQFTKDNDPRITKVGKILRLIRLDELPQAWNILKNDMSFIGPRPERPGFVTELVKMVPYYSARHLVKPGLTGWSQVNYGYADTLESNLIKLQYDLYYIKNRSLLLDGVILLKTVNTVIKWLGR